MQGPEKNSYKEFDNEKKFLRLENSPPPPPHNFSNGPSLSRFNWYFYYEGEGGGESGRNEEGERIYRCDMVEYLLQLPHLLQYNYYTCHS